ncbi:hypothetical protein Xen7305DRAFT_00049670 [Xenococcus sp. PCC 7305]|uniref:DUF4194 domain-containing protein n=1 Tax=Xenococcus sp. PCC 7305 TaxID=102125 RepID=UPI0002AC8926|nr:DUF4194 domain-containing protein [Xenococcus sp. PCC 7305]ELS05224.1 hypothetical protein Xen7305DRAFT_00049670 [Xenococcus sp. PCC 7305]
MSTQPRPAYAPVIIKLFKGVIYSNDSHWNQLQSYLTPLKEFFGQLGLEIRNYETDGFAYLTQPEADPEDESEPLPRLTTRHPLSFKMTILCILLREELRQFNTSEATGQLVISIEKIRDLLQPYLPESNNEEKFRRNVNSLVKQAENLEFLRQLSGQDDKYEIRAILKAKLDAQTLTNLKQKLAEYAANSTSAETDS